METTNTLREVAIIFDPARPYDRRIVRGVAAYVQNEAPNWSLYLEEDPERRIPDLSAWAGDGILANFDSQSIAQAVSGKGIPVVGIGGGYGYYENNKNIPYVRTDNKLIAELAANHLLDLGFQNFAFCSEPPSRSNGWAKEREKAFLEYLTTMGFSCEVFLGKYTAEQNWQKLQHELQQWLSTLPARTGLMACHDIRARHVLQACRAQKLRVPEDIAIVGVDNDDVMCELTRPPLTSIEQGTRRIGYKAASLLDAMMNGKMPEQHGTAIPPEGLVSRQSTDVLAIDDEDIAAALSYIRQHACDPIQVKDVIYVANMSRSTIEAKFHGLLGRTVHSEIRRVQLNTAIQLLKSSSMPIKEIVRCAGISSVQYFSTMTRQATGQTPGQIRSEAQH